MSTPLLSRGRRSKRKQQARKNDRSPQPPSTSGAQPAPSRAQPHVCVRDATKAYRLGQQTVHALKGVSIEIAAGEFVAIMGPSGSGKSTLMNLIGGLDVPSTGTVEILGNDLTRLSSNKIAHLRNRHIGFVFQQFNLLARVSAVRQVMLPMSYARMPTMDAQARARECLAAVDLDARIDHTPAQLSGGQQQRVAIARALVNDPAILLADEPTGALDSVTSHEIMQLFTRLNATGKTIILVTHDNETARYARRIVTFRDGLISGDVREPRDVEHAA